VIRREEYVSGTRDRPEVGVFTQSHATRPPVPWGKIAVGDTVWMKWSSGPIVARARVAGFRQIENCTPDALRLTTAGYRLHELEGYWSSLPSHFFGMTIYLDREEWLETPVEPAARSRGESWVILKNEREEIQWLRAGTKPVSPPLLTSSGRGRTRTIPAAVRFQVLRRDGFACTYCGRKPPQVRLHVDHVRSFVSGGSNEVANLRTACEDCNLGKGSQSL
jgi:hypothetical protein